MKKSVKRRRVNKFGARKGKDSHCSCQLKRSTFGIVVHELELDHFKMLQRQVGGMFKYCSVQKNYNLSIIIGQWEFTSCSILFTFEGKHNFRTFIIRREGVKSFN